MRAHLQSSTSIEPIEVSFTLSVLGISDPLKSEALAKAKEAYVMTLLAAGEITSGKAASLLNLSRLEIIEGMGQQNIPLFDDSMDIDLLHQEIPQASDAVNASNR